MSEQTSNLWYNKNTQVTASDKLCQNMGLPISSRVVMQQYGFYPLMYDVPEEPADQRYFELKESGTTEFDPKFVVYRRNKHWVMKNDDELRAAKNEQINANYNHYVASIFDNYDEFEKSTWQQQRQLAWDHHQGRTLPRENLLQMLADQQKITLDEMASRVLAKVRKHDETLAYAISRRNALQAAVAIKVEQDLIDFDVTFVMPKEEVPVEEVTTSSPEESVVTLTEEPTTTTEPTTEV